MSHQYDAPASGRSRKTACWRAVLVSLGVVLPGRRWAERRSRGRRDRFEVELLEQRLVPAIVSLSSVVVTDDFVSIDSNSSVAVDVLANDSDPDGKLDVSTLMVSSEPAHGTAYVEPTELGSMVVTYTPEYGFKGTDFFSYTVQETDGGGSYEATVTVTVLNQRPIAFDAVVETPESEPAVIDVLAHAYDPDGVLDPLSLAITSQPARGRVALLEMDGTLVARYTPDPGASSVLVVDDPQDVNDGNFSPGHLSLREAIWLANADHHSDVFRYTVSDDDGLISNEATVTINFTPTPTIITFAPRLTALGPATLSISRVGDISEGNSAFAITTPITIQGPTGANGITLAGLGSKSDLRLFVVPAGGDLTLQNLTLKKWASDSSGGTIYVEREGTAALTHCTISNSFAAADGGAIFNNGILTLTDSTLSGNRARYGGGLMNYGGALLIGSTLASNRAVDGAGFNSGGDTYAGRVTLIDCRLSGNKAEDRGGGFFLHGSSASLTDCTLIGNSAHEGGGFANFGHIGTVTLNRSIIKGNSAVNGGGIYNAPGNSPVQMGGGDSPGVIALNSCTIADNSAQRGGGLFNLSDATLTNCTVSGNRANQGGGIFHDARNPVLSQSRGSLGVSSTLFSANIAKFAGGGLFNNGAATIDASTFSKNRADRGGALYNDLGSTDVTSCIFTKNVSTRGAELLNHLGVLSLTSSTVAQDSHLTFIKTDGMSETGFVATSRGAFSLGIAAPVGVRIVKGPDGIRYALTRSRDLMRQLPGSGWTILDDRVLEYEIAPNGDIYWLNDRREVYRAQAGYAGNILGAGVRGFEMDQNGTVYELSSFSSPSSFARYGSLTAPLLDTVEDPLGSPEFCINPPTPEEILHAARLGAPDIQNFLVTVEPIVDSMDAPRYFPNFGLAQMHVSEYKVTMHFDAMYFDTTLNEYVNIDETSAIIYIDRNHLHRYVLGQPSEGSLPHFAANHAAADNSAIGAVPSDASNTTTYSSSSADLYEDFIVPERYTGASSRSLVSAPDGTIYHWGSDPEGYHGIGLHALPLVLQRLSPGRNWEVLVPVFQFAVDSQSTLYTLNGNHELQSLRSTSTSWTTLDTNVQSFSLAADGTLYALNANHELRSLRVGSTRWTTVDTGVQSFSMAPDGTIYELNDLQQLKRLTGRSQWSILDRGVQSFSMAPDGTLYELNGRGQLKRLVGRSHWSVLDVGVQTFTRAVDGAVYVLDDRHQLKRLTARDHWTLLDVGVDSFVIGPNVFQVLFVLNENHELKMSEAGAAWVTLRTDVVSLTIDDSDRPSTVRARDTMGRMWFYNHGIGYPPILDPVVGSDPFCLDPPKPDEIAVFAHLRTNQLSDLETLGDRFLYDPTSPFSNFRIIVEPILDEVDPARIFPYTGPARLHHCHYKCTIYYDDARVEGTQELVLFLQHDHLIRASVEPNQFLISEKDIGLYEGNAGDTAITLHVLRDGTKNVSASVDYEVKPDSGGLDAADFGGIFPSGTINFAPDETEKTIIINIRGDTIVEGPDSFVVSLLNPSVLWSVSGDVFGAITILNDDA